MNDLFSIDLLPQSPEAMVRDEKMQQRIVNTLLLLIDNLIEAIHHFYVIKKYDAFDPHVGETACQIRALRLLQLVQESENDVSLDPNTRIKDLMTIKNNLQSLRRTNFLPNHRPNNQLTIIEYIKIIGCYFTISKSEWFLVKAYFLTTFKITKSYNNTYINYDWIANKACISRKLAKKLARYYQVKLAHTSCEYIFKLTDDINMNTEILKMLCRLDDDGRPVLPCYLFSKILFKRILNNNLSVLIIAYRKSKERNQTTCLLFCPGVEKGILISQKIIDQTLLNKTCFVVTGESITSNDELETDNQFTRRFNALGLEKILLANMATHPQYSGTKLHEYRHAPYKDSDIPEQLKNEMNNEIQQMTQVASEIACCHSGKSLFFVNHIYCDTVINQLQKITSYETYCNNSPIKMLHTIL